MVIGKNEDLQGLLHYFWLCFVNNSSSSCLYDDADDEKAHSSVADCLNYFIT